MQNIIKRDEYLRRFIDRKENGLIKVITGIRRSGKSFLLFNLFYDYLIESGVKKEQIITIALDDDTFVKYRDPDELSKYIRRKIVNSDMYYILIDEVQYAITKDELKNPENIRLYNVLNGLMRLRNVDIYVTGSNSKMLTKDVLTAFRGRGDEVKVYPISFKEYYSFVGGDKSDAYEEYALYGGMPLVLTKKSDAEKMNYLNYLIESFLFSNAKRYDVKGKKYFEYPSKYYCTDIGLRNARLNFRQQEETHIMENVIYNELCIRGFDVDVGIIECAERTENGNTKRCQLGVDFVANKGSQRYYVQSAFAVSDSAKREQETRGFVKIPDSFKKIVVVRDNIIPWHDENGILYVGIEQFLLEDNSLNL